LKKSLFKYTGDDAVAVNRRARHDYEISDSFECGVMLTGTEVKSIRQNGAQIAESYASIDTNPKATPRFGCRECSFRLTRRDL
jgi:SsrA-binding protein